MDIVKKFTTPFIIAGAALLLVGLAQGNEPVFYIGMALMLFFALLRAVIELLETKAVP